MRRVTTTQKKSILILDKGDDISELKNPADIIIALLNYWMMIILELITILRAGKPTEASLRAVFSRGMKANQLINLK